MTETTKILVSRVLSAGYSPISSIFYPREELEKMIERAKEDTDSLSKILGTLDQTTDSMYLDLTSVATKVTDIYLNGEDLIVEQEILETPMGKVLEEILESERQADALNEESAYTLSITPAFVGKIDHVDDVKTASRLELTRIIIQTI